MIPHYYQIWGQLRYKKSNTFKYITNELYKQFNYLEKTNIFLINNCSLINKAHLYYLFLNFII